MSSRPKSRSHSSWAYLHLDWLRRAGPVVKQQQPRPEPRPAGRLVAAGGPPGLEPAGVPGLRRRRTRSPQSSGSHRAQRLPRIEGIRASLPLIRLLYILRDFVLRALRVITGTLRELVLVNGALALAGDIEDFAQVDV